ncbi:MAG: glycosyltransferase [Bacillota bacterium]|jgi:glycosyltransferase involved in cell wall biosynthesis
MDKNKLLMITPFSKSQRGNSLTVARLRHGLQGRGFLVEVLSLEESAWQRSLTAMTREKQYVLIHGFHGYYFGQVLAKVPEIKQFPLILTATGTDLNYYLNLTGTEVNLVYHAFRAANKIVVFNEEFNEMLRSLDSDLAAKLITIPQGVCLPGDKSGNLSRNKSSQRWDLRLTEENIVFVMPSGLRKIKNIELAINALEKVHADFPQIRLVLLGAVIEADYYGSLLKRIKELEWVSYLGEVPHDEVRSILSLGDIVLNTSDSEGQPQGALEAMSLGLPAILSAVPGNLNLIEAGVEGFYIRTEKELIEAAKTLINNPSLRKQMGAAARRLVEARFSVKKELAAYSELYHQLLAYRPKQ